MKPMLGWYIHHHGRGHLARMLAIAPYLDAQIRCFSSLPQPEGLPPHCSWTVLARDDDAVDGRDPRRADPTADEMLHWAPLRHYGHRNRLTTIADSVAEAPVDAFVVDVSVEVTLFVRLLGIPVVLIAQPGLRDDFAHQLGFRAATRIIAPWPQAILEPAHLAEVTHKTVYTGGISRYEDRIHSRGERLRQNTVVLLGGLGGSTLTDADVDEAQLASHRPWRNLGGTPSASWSADPWEDLTSAGVVVSWAGQNSVADLAAAGAPAVVIPQERPFAEQRETARALDRAGLAVVAPEWPSGATWTDLIERASVLRPEWDQWQVPGAAARAADVILHTAGASL